jgi:hypothetical protein
MKMLSTLVVPKSKSSNFKAHQPACFASSGMMMIMILPWD